jgi:hypothetical protein
LQHIGKAGVGAIVLATCVTLFAQATKPASSPQPSVELPASLQTKVVAGSTPVGTEVRAKLTMATLMDGVVIPEDAVISGHVEQSVAKTADAPSLLKIKFESARWKKGSALVTLYLAGCYYPIEFQSPTANDPTGLHGNIGINMGSAAESSPSRTNGGLANSGLPNSGGMSGPMDATRLDNNYPDPRPGTTVSEVSKHWVRLENVDTLVTPDGSLQIASQQRNLKLDKGTIYLLRNSLPSTAK